MRTERGSRSWLGDRLGARLVTETTPVGLTLPDLVGLALRDNPRRAQLLVSQVLGKHIPCDPHLVYGAGRLLGALVAGALDGLPCPIASSGGTLLRDSLAGTGTCAPELISRCDQYTATQPPRPDVLVLGYAETATALGQCVALGIRADYLHSTRRSVPGLASSLGFTEEHSHASEHLILPAEPGWLRRAGPVVLVDDELSTGRTALNTIAMLQAIMARSRYLVATLVDVRNAADREIFDRRAAQLGCTIEVISLVQGHIELPPGMLARARQLVGHVQAAGIPRSPATAARGPRFTRVPVGSHWPADLAEGGRHGLSEADGRRLQAATAAIADRLAACLDPKSSVHVLGFEELMFAPLQIARALADLLSGPARVRFSTTTRSPVLAVADPGYAITTSLTFASHDRPSDGAGDRFAYNLSDCSGASANAWSLQTNPPVRQLVLVVDSVADTAELIAADGLVGQLCARYEQVWLVVLPVCAPSGARPEAGPLRGPGFGSYPPEDVGWLLTDLSGIELEAPTEEREELIQSGGAHYAQSLPIEYQPSAEYQRLFQAALQRSAGRVAQAVGLVAELILSGRRRPPVLVSLARAGTPVGILVRRWAYFRHQLDLPHYAVSIVRGRGIDLQALRYLAVHHDPASVVFVDGWTGKGAIVRELAAAITGANQVLGLNAQDGFTTDLAVLADTGQCVRTFGTRDDFLIPSACLNSTVSGLVSRTVLNDELLAPGQFHGAKFYADLAGADVSTAFLDRVSGQFGSVQGTVLDELPTLLSTDRTPTWTGWRAVEQLSADYGIANVNLIKPGVGETTRVLLRRVPWRILVRTDAVAELAHVLLLAAQRGVTIDYVADLAYSCVGLIHPGFTRGAESPVAGR